MYLKYSINWRHRASDPGAPIQYLLETTIGGSSVDKISGVLSAELFGQSIECIGAMENGVTCYELSRTLLLDVSGLTGGAPPSRLLRVDFGVTGESGFLDPSSISGSLMYDFQFVMNESPWAFLPLASQDAAAKCAAPDAGACRVNFHPRIPGGSATGDDSRVPKGVIKCTLYDRSSLAGISTNFGADAGPDYEFQAKPDIYSIGSSGTGQEAISAGSVRSLAVTVKSLDFGGTGKLKCSIALDGLNMTIEATILKPSDAPPNFAVPNGTQFASLPIDQNGNGIADSWDLQYGVSSASEDNDVGGRGDGLSAHDEYRGFHHLDPDKLTSTIWSRTDPRDALDLFYWSKVSKSNCSGGGYSEDCIHTAVRAILGPQSTTVLKVRPVNALQANSNGKTAYDVQQVDVFNQNSRAFGSRQNFAVVFQHRDLNASCSGPVRRSGVLGNAQTFGSDGIPILLDVTQIGACANLNSFPPAVYLARTVAHETGHKLDCSHPTRSILEYQGAINENNLRATVAGMPITEYLVDPRSGREDTVYYWTKSYSALEGGVAVTKFEDYLYPVYRLQGLTIGAPVWFPPPNTATGGLAPTPDASVAIKANSNVPTGGATSSLLAQTQPYSGPGAQTLDIMGWSLKLTGTDYSSWAFSGNSLAALKVWSSQ